MNFNKLKSFIDLSAKSGNPKIKTAAESLTDQMMNAEQAEEIAQPTLHAQSQNKPLNDKPKDEVDVNIDTWMQDIAKPEPDASQFGKVASAYITDIKVTELPKETQQDIIKFIGELAKTAKVVRYGMTVPELLPKVDQHNYKSAKKHVEEDIKKYGKKSVADRFQSKVDTKYILILNDSIIDGHHHLACADVLGISCSLKVLDLTPARFQQKKASVSLFHKLAYGIQDYSRQGTA